jgi:hypothetical protein
MVGLPACSWHQPRIKQYYSNNIALFAVTNQWNFVPVPPVSYEGLRVHKSHTKEVATKNNRSTTREREREILVSKTEGKRSIDNLFHWCCSSTRDDNYAQHMCPSHCINCPTFFEWRARRASQNCSAANASRLEKH